MEVHNGKVTAVWEIVRNLNHRNCELHRNPDGPRLVLKLVKVEQTVV
jgi:hypothetical protein